MTVSPGLKYKKYVSIQNTSEVMVITNETSFNIDDIVNYKHSFDKLREDGVIVNDNFDNVHWKLFTGDFMIHLHFDMEIQPMLQLAFKSFILFKLDEQNVSCCTIKNVYHAVRNAIYDTSFFKQCNTTDYRLNIKKLSNSRKQGLYYVKEFLSFYNMDFSETYLEILSSIKVPKCNTRTIPNYHSIILFDVLITSYFESLRDPLLRERYYPVLLWWKITSVIPMRPIEFTLLKRDSCYYNKAKNSYVLKIERRKNRVGKIKVKGVKLPDEIDVTEEIYNYIQDYISLTRDIESDNYLFQAESYDRVKLHSLAKSQIYEFTDDTRIRTPQLRRTLHWFYKYIIEKQLGFNVYESGSTYNSKSDNTIERLKAGDTRHLSMCNMMLQGFNPLTIAQLAGHSSIREQMSYLGHMNTFIEANTFLLSRDIAKKIKSNFVDEDYEVNWTNGQLEKIKLNSEYYRLPKVNNGRCSSKSFPKQCIAEECIFCNHIIIDESLTEEVIDMYKERLDKRIKTQIDCIKSITKGMIYNNSGDHDPRHQEMLIKENNRLKVEMERKSTLEVFRLLIKGAV